MCVVNSYTYDIVICFTSQIKPVMSPGVDLGFTILFIFIFVISLCTAFYISFLENKRSKTQKEKDVAPAELSIGPHLTNDAPVTDKKDDGKPIEEEVKIEVPTTIEAVESTKAPISQKESIFKIFEVIHPGKVFHKLKVKEDETTEKPLIPCTVTISTPVQSIDTPDNIAGAPSIQPVMEKQAFPEETVGESLYSDTVSIARDRQLPPEMAEPIIDVVTPAHPDIEEPISQEEPSPEEPAPYNYYTDMVPISSVQPLPPETEVPFTEVEITPMEAEPFYYEQPVVFAITNLWIRPAAIHPGDIVFISFIVTNHGMVADYCPVTLNIGGFTIYTDHIYLSSMESKYVNLPITAVQPGIWDVDVNGVVGTMTVLG